MENEERAQYSGYYRARFSQMSGFVTSNPELSNTGLPLRKLADRLEDECVVVATLFLVSALKHSILSSTEATDRVGAITYASADSLFFLEDETGRLQIEFSPDFSSLFAPSSGLVLGWIGHVDEKNVFQCRDVIFPSEQSPASPSTNSPGDSSPHAPHAAGTLMIISNPRMNKNFERLKVIKDLYQDAVKGILILGDLFSDEPSPPFNLFASWLGPGTTPVFILPGLSDMTTRLLPQQPLSKMLLLGKQDMEYYADSIKMLPNPYQGDLMKFPVALISQHIVKDLLKYVPQSTGRIQRSPADYRIHAQEEAVKEYHPEEHADDEDIMRVLEQMVATRHMAPNAPDTVGCIPFEKGDPLILGPCEMLATGGCRDGNVRKANGCLLVGVPDFDETGRVMLLDLRTREFEVVEMGEIDGKE